MLKLIVGITTTLIIAGLWHVTPIMYPLPKPTGAYAIGIKIMHLVDAQRQEQFATRNIRELMIHIWYPAEPNTGNLSYYFGDKMPAFQEAFANFYHIPSTISSMLWNNIPTHAYKDALFAKDPKKFPIVLFSHGLLGWPSDSYLSIIENIVSHGYIVVGIDHAYFNIFTQFPNNRIATSFALDAQFQKMEPTEQNKFLIQAIDIYKADMQFVVEQLTSFSQDGQNILYSHIDLDKIAVMGHSAGGTAAIEFCRTSNLCKAAIDLDGWYDHIIGHEPLKKPLLLLFGEKSIEVTEPTPEYLARKQLTRDQYFEREQKIADHKAVLRNDPLCSMTIIPNATHGDFGDEILEKWPLNRSSSDPYKVLATINTQILNFLNKNLAL